MRWPGPSAGGVVGAAAGMQLGPLVLDLSKLALQTLPRTVLGLVVVPAGQIAQRIAVRLPCTVRALVELAQLALVTLWGGDVHRAPPIRRGLKAWYSYPLTTSPMRARRVACRPARGVPVRYGNRRTAPRHRRVPRRRRGDQRRPRRGLRTDRGRRRAGR